MKTGTPLLVVSFVVIFAAGAARAASNNGSLFNGNEFQFSVGLQTANGNVDVQPQQNTVYHTQTTTIHTEVLAPTVPVAPTPTPSSSPIDEELHKAAIKKSTGSRLIDPTFKKTTTTRQIVNTHRTEHNAFGGGVKLGYFFTRYIGATVEGDFLGGNPYDTSVIGALMFRYPFEFGAKTETGYAKDGKDGKSVVTGPTWGLAPYILAGGGGQWDGRGVGIGTVGGGLEFRFQQHWGMFVEGRWVVHDSRQNYAAETIGVEYAY